MIDARSPSLGSSESGPPTSPEFVSSKQAQIPPRARGGVASQRLCALGTTGQATPVATTGQQSPGGSNSRCVSATTQEKKNVVEGRNFGRASKGHRHYGQNLCTRRRAS